MTCGFPIRSGLLAVLLTGIALQASADPIGDVTKVEISAFGTPPGETRRDLAVGLPVVQDELLETVVGGGVSVTFADGSEFHLGSESAAANSTFLEDFEKSLDVDDESNELSMFLLTLSLSYIASL